MKNWGATLGGWAVTPARHGSRACLGLLVLGAAVAQLQAEDSDRLRPYFQVRSGEFDTAWGVLDSYGLSLGANLNRYLGFELAGDFFERDFEHGSLGSLGEESVAALVPQIRLRYPLMQNRLVPYVIAGAGPAFLQFNDRQPSGYALEIEAEGTRAAFVAGAGLEYFLDDQVAFGLEAKYLWVDPLDVRVAGRVRELDLSSPLVTFGLRVYLTENQRQPLVEELEAVPSRLFFAVRYGAAALTDDRWVPGVTLDAEASSVADTFSQLGGLSLGANLGLHWGVELSADVTEWNIDLAGMGAVGEYSVYTLVPQLRLRLPLKQGRWVPYLQAGPGLAYGEFNDRKPRGAGLDLEAKGFHPAVSVGGGVEYFISRNLSICAEARWLHSWDHPLRLGGAERSGDLSAIYCQVGFRLYLVELSRPQEAL